MNKFLFLLGVTFGGALGGLFRGPFVPLFTYYFYAVLRPQGLWKRDLMSAPDLGWSFYAAGAAFLTYLPWVFGVIGPADPLRSVYPRFVWPHRLMIAWAVWMTLSFLNANNTGVAEGYYTEFMKIFAVYLLGTQVVRSYGQVRALYTIAAFTLSYIALEMLQIYLQTGKLILYRSGFAGLDNNGAGLMLAMGIPLCYFAWEFTKGYHRWLYLVAIPVIAEVVLSSYSRGAMLSALLVSPLYLVYSRKRKFLLVCFAIAAVAIPVVTGDEIKARFSTVKEATADDSFQSRLNSWDCARRIANDYPVFGAGVRCSNLLTKDYGADMIGRTIHNQYLQIAADTGWVGLAIYLALLGSALATMWGARARLWGQADPESVRAVAMLGGVECAFWTFTVGAMALSLEVFELPYLLLLMGTQIAAISQAEVARPRFTRARPAALRIPASPRGPLGAGAWAR